MASENTGYSLLKRISDVFLKISFLLADPNDNSQEKLAEAIKTLERIHADIEERLKENYSWRKSWREISRDHFSRYYEHFGKPATPTLNEHMERFLKINPKTDAERIELLKLSMQIAIRVQNIPQMIQEDANRAAEPFLELLR